MMSNNNIKKIDEILPGCISSLDGRAKGGIPEPYRTELFNIVGLNPNKSEDAEMCRKEICQRTITKIEIDIVEIHEELKYENDEEKRKQLRESIMFAEEIITDLKQMEAEL